jgi:hypothetical protein
MTPIFEWYGAWCGSMKGYQKDTCLKDIAILSQKMITILGSIINKIGRGGGPI